MYNKYLDLEEKIYIKVITKKNQSKKNNKKSYPNLMERNTSENHLISAKVSTTTYDSCLSLIISYNRYIELI